jgi:hypothetical protein
MSHGDLSAETITILRTQLDGVRKAVSDSLRSSKR